MSVVMITGCSSGIGLETALAFARNGDTTVATMRNTAKAETLQKRAADEGLTIEVEALDVTDDASVDAAVSRVTERHGTVDVLVNNAGVSNSGSVEQMAMDNAMRLMDTNFWGPMRMIRATLPTMRSQRSGVIVNVSSLASRIPATMYAGMYAASKVALNALSEALQAEIDPFEIRVVSIEPGFFGTEISANNLSADEPTSDVYGADQEWIRQFFESGVEGGAAPSVVADAVVAAATDPEAKLHTPVGDDAAMYLDLWGQVAGYEGWMEAVTPLVEGAVGPRPAPA